MGVDCSRTRVYPGNARKIADSIDFPVFNFVYKQQTRRPHREIPLIGR